MLLVDGSCPEEKLIHTSHIPCVSCVNSLKIIPVLGVSTSKNILVKPDPAVGVLRDDTNLPFLSSSWKTTIFGFWEQEDFISGYIQLLVWN